MSKTENKVDNFEHSLDELEGLVRELEAGELSLEQSLSRFERGVKLTRECHDALRRAELRVEGLSEELQQQLQLDTGDDADPA